MPRYRISCTIPCTAEVEAENEEDAWDTFLGSSQSDVSAGDGAEDISIEEIEE